MKAAVSLSLFKIPLKAPALYCGDITKEIPHIKELGFQGVDLFVKDPADEVSKEAVKLLKKHNLGVGAVMPAALTGQGLFLSHEDAEIRNEIIKRIKAIIEYTAELGGMVPLGLVRGSHKDDEPKEEVMERFTDSVEKLVPHSQKYNVPLIVEPINYYEINTLNNCIETADYIKSTGMPLHMLMDTFHMFIEDASLKESILYCKEYIKHVHFLDTNRGAPGTGQADMDMIYETLKSIGYDGFLCMEAWRRQDAEAVARKGIEYFKKVGLVS